MTLKLKAYIIISVGVKAAGVVGIESSYSSLKRILTGLQLGSILLACTSHTVSAHWKSVT